MNTNKLVKVVMGAVMAGLIGCGGSSSTGDLPAGLGGGGSTGGGIGGTGIRSAGMISAKGSVTVNGVKYETEDARIVMDGDEMSDDSRLKVGMVVEVEGRINTDGTTGVAAVVRFDDNVEGPVTQIDAGAATIEVMGQTVLINDQTIFDNSSVSPANISGLSLGDVVEVSGAIDAQGRIRATHIEKTSSGNLEVTGFAGNVGVDAFSLNGLTIDTGNAVFEDFSSIGLQNGDFVEVKGSAYNATSNTLTAARVENKTSRFDDDTEIEVESFILSINSDGFVLTTPSGPVDVVIDSATEFFGGTAADIRIGAKVEVEGSGRNSALLADKVSFRENIRIEVAASGADGSTLRLGLRQLSAITVTIDARTALDDKRNNSASTADPEAFLNTIQPDDHLKIRGRLSGNGSGVVAVELEVDDPESDLSAVELRGPIGMAPTDNGILQILGVEVDTASTVRFEDRFGNIISRETFFSAINAGTLVEAKGQLTVDNSIDASELELED